MSPAPLRPLRGKSKCQPGSARKNQPQGPPTPSLSGILILSRFPVVSPAPLRALRGKSKCQPGSARKNQPQGRAWGAHPKFVRHFDPCQISGCEPRPPRKTIRSTTLANPHSNSALFCIARGRVTLLTQTARVDLSIPQPGPGNTMKLTSGPLVCRVLCSKCRPMNRCQCCV